MMNSAPASAFVSQPSSVRDFFTLLKPGVMSLVVFTGWAGMVLAPGSLNPFLALLAVLCIAVGSGAGGAINMWYDRDIDAIMARTAKRPVPAGRILPDDALAFGVTLSLFAVALMGLAVGWLASGLLAFAIFFYTVIYTIWLKRHTPQNIVIGGAAGAFPPMIGWAAASGNITWDSFILFLIVFLWTPPHFWALALYRSQDYARAGVPMLPVVAGLRETKKQIAIYSVLLTLVSLMPWVTGLCSGAYALAAAILGGKFMFGALQVWRDETDRSAKRLFGYSILYLFALFACMLVDHTYGGF